MGSNMDSPILNIKAGLIEMEKCGIFIEKRSSLYLTEPVDFKKQEWFVNLAVSVITEFEPLDLLFKIKEIERALGRKNEMEKGPRPLDIDIVLMDFPPFYFESSVLVIPHKAMHLRKFVLLPLLEIFLDEPLPIFKKTIYQLLHELKDESEVYPMLG